jgi:hypothetical protein
MATVFSKDFWNKESFKSLSSKEQGLNIDIGRPGGVAIGPSSNFDSSNEAQDVRGHMGSGMAPNYNDVPKDSLDRSMSARSNLVQTNERPETSAEKKAREGEQDNSTQQVRIIDSGIPYGSGNYQYGQYSTTPGFWEGKQSGLGTSMSPQIAVTSAPSVLYPPNIGWPSSTPQGIGLTIPTSRFEDLFVSPGDVGSGGPAPGGNKEEKESPSKKPERRYYLEPLV